MGMGTAARPAARRLGSEESVAANQVTSSLRAALRQNRAAIATASIYIALLLAANLAWEGAHVRLYTLWNEASPGEVARAVLHCTAGDGVLGAAALWAALALTGARAWPDERFGLVALVTTLLGVAATVIIEWLAVEVLGRWAYTPAMPRLPPLGTGLTPVLQWVLLPTPCLWAARRLVSASRRSRGRSGEGHP